MLVGWLGAEGIKLNVKKRSKSINATGIVFLCNMSLAFTNDIFLYFFTLMLSIRMTYKF